MKKNNSLKITFLIIALFAMCNINMHAQVGIGNTSPQGALDITSTTDGLLVPRLALVNTTTATIVTPTESEIVYNTATINDVTPGFYYWDSAKWVRVVTGAVSNDWATTGNTATTAGTNYIGTTDAVDFVTKTNNTEKTRVTSAGNVGIGNPAPVSKLDVAAGVTAVNSIINATGNINDYLQFNVQNTSTGTQAQSGYSATADNGNATTGFAWLGINNSTFNFPTSYNIGLANDVSYIGSGQDMYIANAHTSKSIIFSTGKTTTPFFNERMRITNAGNVGIGTPTPSAKSSLDVSSTTTGVLIPRMTTAQRTAIAPTATDLGLKVYDTTTSTFWFWNGAIWVQDATSTNSWGLTGNAGTAPATNFVGTTDAVDFVTRTNNTEKTRVTSAGNVGIGNPAPVSKLDVATGVTAVNSIINATGSINDYLQFNVQNTSTGTQAQSGYSATADNGSATTGFAWIGINNSTFNFPTSYNIGVANDVSYIGSGQDMYIANAHTSKSIIFSTGKTTTPFFDERMRITNAGNVGIGTPAPDTSALLDVSSTNKGVSFPNINLLSETDAATIATPKVGLMVYNTNTTLPCGKGLYFNNGTVAAPVWSCFSKTTRQYHAYDTGGRAAVTSNVPTQQPGCTISVVIPTGQIADIKIDAVLGATNSTTTAGLYSNVDVIAVVDGAYLPKGGYNRITVLNSSAGPNGFNASTLSTVWSNVTAGTHTIQLFSARFTGTTSVNIGSDCAVSSNCGEINAIVTYR